MRPRRNVRLVTADTDRAANCGLACVAMIAGCSFSKVRKLALEMGYGKDGIFYTDASDLRKLGSRVGITFARRKRKFKCWDTIPHRSVVAINYKEDEKENQYWHWVVLVRGCNLSYVLDPNKSLRSGKRTDFGRMKKNARWYLPVDSG